MATLYYRPYTTDLQNDDESSISELSNRDDLLPELRYVFDPDKNSIESELDNQQHLNENKETDIDRYKVAMRNMSSEILFLREQLKNLMQKNNQLHYNPYGHQRAANELIAEVINDNSISKAELLEKYMALNSKYEEATVQLSRYQEKVHKLQIDLIKKNDKEAEYLKINKAHSTQNILIQNLQKRVQKIRVLEETIKDQESIINKMEKQIEKNNKNKRNNLSPIMEVISSREKDLNLALQEENKRLRNEIEAVKLSTQPKLTQSSMMSDSERLELYQLLDKAEQRIIALERQVSNNQKEWRRDKTRNLESDEFGLSKIKF